MNQHQRKFLTEAIEKQYHDEQRRLRAKRPKAPSLNNYLVAAILDGSFVMRDQQLVRRMMIERVRDLGKGESLTITESRRRYGGSSLEDEEERENVTIPADLIFELPAGYRMARVEYEEALGKWQAEEAALDSAFNAMRIKVQLGSDEALEALVGQADRLCSMSLTATSRMMLAEGSKE